MKPLLSYVGSKGCILDLLKGTLPQNTLYIEPFAGGFTLGLSLLENSLVSKVILNDLDIQVATFWSSVKRDYWGLVSAIDNLLLLLQNNASILDSKKLLTLLDSTVTDDLTSSALFYLYRRLNKGSASKCIPQGSDFGYTFYTDLFLQASKLLKTTTIVNKHFVDLRKYDTTTSLWYLDPPYFNARNARYYTACKELAFDHEELRDFCKSLKGNFILSYDDCPTTRHLYADFNIYPLTLVSGSNKLGHTKELIISNCALTLDYTNYPCIPQATKKKETLNQPCDLRLSLDDILSEMLTTP